MAVLNNPSKNPLFTVEERKQLLREVAGDLENVQIDSFQDLLVNYIKMKKAHVIIRGLRAISDFENELQMASINHFLDEQIETFFMMTSPQYSFLSSSIVKEIASFNGPVSDLVPEAVERALREKFKNV